jgi:hypothetical protein
LIAPNRTSEIAAVSARPDCMDRYCLPLPGNAPSYLCAATDPDAVPQLIDLSSENEEQDPADALDDLRGFWLIRWSFRKVSDRHLISPQSILSLYPLRC